MACCVFLLTVLDRLRTGVAGRGSGRRGTVRRPAALTSRGTGQSAR